jgi:sugar phosphate isomerase/epimerase
MRYATLQDHLGCEKNRAVERATDVGLDGLELIIPDGVHNVGADGMHLDMTGIDPDADELWSPVKRDRLRTHAEDLEIELPSICPTFLNFRPGLIAADPGERGSVAEIYEQLVTVVDDIGGDLILIPFFLDAEIGSEAERNRVADAIQPAMDAAEDADVTLAIENTLPADENRELLDRIDSPSAGIYYDVANTTAQGYDPGEEIRALGDAVSRIHFKDHDERGKGTMLGEGRVDFEGVASALDEVEYDGWIMLETMFVDDPVEAMIENLQFARELVE